MSWRLKWLACWLGLVAMGLAGISSAAAHAGLQSAQPAPGEVIRQSPPHITLTFTEAVQDGQISLYNADGQQQDTVSARQTADDQFRAAVNDTLAGGEYSVVWMAVSTDGHRISGSYNFVIDPDAGGDSDGLSPWMWLLMLGGLAVTVSGWWWLRRKILEATR